MIVGWVWVKKDNRVVLLHAALCEIFGGVFGRLLALPVGDFRLHRLPAEELLPLRDSDGELTSDCTFTCVGRATQKADTLSVGTEQSFDNPNAVVWRRSRLLQVYRR